MPLILEATMVQVQVMHYMVNGKLRILKPSLKVVSLTC